MSMASVRIGAIVAAALALGACGSGEAPGGSEFTANNSAQVLRDAAEQSTPAAREVLLNQAEAIEGGNVQLPPGAAGSPVQDAMSKAGNAQAAPLEPPPPRQAVPNRDGLSGPPPTTVPQR